MQQELWEAVKRLGVSANQQPNGTLIFNGADWGRINLEAHRLRDERFGKWYFVNLSSEAFQTRAIQRLRAHSLPYEVEHHDLRVVLLLPKSDERKHQEVMLE
jgi:hypothetical protein